MLHNNRCDWALLIVRLTLGSTLLLHGLQKVLGMFGGTGLPRFALWLAKYGVSWQLSYLAAFVELAAGCMLIVGIQTRLAAIMSIVFLSTAIYLVHSSSGYFELKGGFEYPLNLIFLACALLIAGPGKCTFNLSSTVQPQK